MYLECCVCVDSPIFYEHWGCQGGQVFSSHQLQHQWVGLWVDAAGLGGQQARLGSIAEQVWQELVVCGHGSVDVLIPEGRRVAVHFHRATGGTKRRSKVTHSGPYRQRCVCQFGWAPFYFPVWIFVIFSNFLDKTLQVILQLHSKEAFFDCCSFLLRFYLIKQVLL